MSASMRLPMGADEGAANLRADQLRDTATDENLSFRTGIMNMLNDGATTSGEQVLRTPY